MKERRYEFDIPTNTDSIIKVIGVGGGGSNAVNHMYRQGIRGVDFYVCNTDVQALQLSPVPNKIQLGANLTGGLGAGANPEKGRNAAIESKDEIRKMLSGNTKMVFITAGMGGGTGTGAAPVIAEIAKEMGILTVGIVTAPFQFEGKPKQIRAEQGIAEMRKYCDSVIVILNNKLREIYGNTTMREAFSQADNVLTKAAKSIAEIITVPGIINVDFEDVRTVMKDSGVAVMGSATAEGENRARRAVEAAITSPLLNDADIFGAKYILLSIMVGDEDTFQFEELEEITQYVQEQAGDSAEVIFGQAVDESLGKAISVTVIATGFHENQRNEPQRTVYDLATSKRIKNPVRDLNRKVPLIFDNEADFFDRDEEPTSPPPSSKPAAPNKPEKIVYRLDGEQIPPPVTLESNEEVRRRVLEEQYKTRLQRMEGTKSIHELSNQELLEKKEIPAYLRRNVKLTDMDSSHHSISRFNITDGENLLGNNRFLHDNVD
ncbi:MAG: cell division protein FtsZ [Cytophagales bacterium]|nr:cell division protein FtsZ [Bernardetiaceae bacterium]MDW8211679.1 cell division protein FtsZ [Cytophagales bacterium]